MRLRQGFIFIILFISSFHLRAQLVGEMEDESKLYAQTKLVNQFFRRFNGEEDEKGERLYPKDKQYQTLKLRKKYVGMLFDESNRGISSDLKAQFGKSVLETKPTFLDFHGKNWFAEVHTIFTMNGKEQPIILFMELENAQLGSKWVITKVYSDLFAPYFVRDTTKVGRFIHPMSHELDFMNLRKAFEHTDSVAQFASKKYTPDQLSVFLYEAKKGNLKFKTVTELKFHFFQIDGWYFEISEQNRSGYNTGWLISNLVKINSEADKNLLRKFLYYEKR